MSRQVVICPVGTIVAEEATSSVGFQGPKGAIEASSVHVPSFHEVATQTGTDKVRELPGCLENSINTTACAAPMAIHPVRRAGCNHFYDTIHDRYVRDYVVPINMSEAFQFVEIGFYNGHGFDAFAEYLLSNAPANTELHSIEISCMDHGSWYGPWNEGKWSGRSFAF
jgi:hypothetical protein